METVVCPISGWQPLNVSELWRHREVLWLLTLRDIKVRYKQTILGVVWTVLQPTMLMLVMTIFFSRMASPSATGLPMPIFLFSGLLPWLFFASATSKASNSVVNSEAIVKKVYVPRLVFPLAAVFSSLIDFIIAFSVLIALMLFYRIAPTWGMLMSPVVVVLIVLLAVGAGTLLGALNVHYRDFRHAVQFLLQIGLFATPTIYSDFSVAAPAGDREITATVQQSADVAGRQRAVLSEEGPEAGTPEQRRDVRRSAMGKLRFWAQLNPMTGLITFFRAATLGRPLPWDVLLIPTATVVVLFVVGCFYFRRMEDTFADVL